MASEQHHGHTVGPSLPDEKAIISLHALSSGHFTLPEWQFVHPVSFEARKTVPSLAFLVQHHNSNTGITTRLLFDLGLRRHVERYAPRIQEHIKSRQPITTFPDVVASLARGGLTPDDIDYVLYSHVHWDHVGEPRDFPLSTFLVGSGSLALFNGTSSALPGKHSFFEQDLLPASRTIELSDPFKSPMNTCPSPSASSSQVKLDAEWKPFKHLPQTLDMFGDGSVLIVNAPGHLPGHVNLLLRVSQTHLVYLGGDACHDRRLLTGEKEISEWNDDTGRRCCIHTDKGAAHETIERIRQLERDGVEVIFAHDVEWASCAENQLRFFGS